MEHKMTQPKQQIQVDIEEKVAEGIYANTVSIVHSPSEMVFDFIRMMPALPKAKVQARIIMTPQNAKAFYLAMTENIKKYEERFGEIKLPGKEVDKSFGFQT
jgi:hypothetical protein